jgi:methionine-rich copper-binding protein CopC
MAAFTSGDIVVYRVGTGASALSSSGTAVFLDEYTPDGTLVQSIALPTADAGNTHALVASGTATSDGLLTLSADGHYLIATGYDATPGTSGVTGGSEARVVGRIGADGAIDTSTALTNLGANNIRSAASTDGTSFYIGSGATGIDYATLGATSATQLTTLTNVRQVEIFGGQLYYDTSASASPGVGVGTVGTGLPTTSGQTPAILPGTSSATSPFSFYLADLSSAVPGVDTLYVADDGLGLRKYSLVSGTWTPNGTVGANADDYRGLTASVSGNTVTLFATLDNGSGADTLVRVVDSSGYNGSFSGTATTVATAATNTAFRGVAFAPVPAVVTPSLSIDDVTLSEGDSGTETFVFTVSLSSPAGPGGVFFNIGTADGTATSGSDYQANLLSGEMIAAGQSTYRFSVTVNGDTLVEPNETFLVNVTNVIGATIADGQGLGTILNDDAADVTPPTLTATSPLDNATDVAIGANIVLTFSEPVKAGTGNIILRPATGADVTIAVGSGQATFNGNQVTINPTADLRPGVAYDVIIGSGVITDTSGNPFAGIAQDALDFVTSFTIPAGTFTTPFTISDPGTFTLLAGTTRTQTSGVGVQVAAGGTTVDIEGVLSETGTGRAVDTGSATFASGTALTFIDGVNGKILSATNDAIRINADVPGGTITVTNSGVIVSGSVDGFGNISGTVSGQALDFNNIVSSTVHTTITNNQGALIGAADADAIRPGVNATIYNDGAIKGQAGAGDTGNDGIDFQSNTGGTVNNLQHGSIEGARHGITGEQPITLSNDGIITGHLGSGVNMDTPSLSLTKVTNHGTIVGTGGYLNGNPNSPVDGDGVDVDGLIALDNYGTIRATGVHVVDPNTGEVSLQEAVTIGGGTINNYAGGLIVSFERAITVDDSGGGGGPNGSNGSNNGNAWAPTTIYNEGTIEGDNGEAIAITDTFADTLTNKGAILGSVSLGGGDDIVNDYAGASFSSTLDGGTGDDIINLLGPGTGALANVVNVEALSVQGGTWTIGDTQSYTNGVTVQGGVLLVDGSLGGSTVLVANGGTLGGHGTVGALTLASGATLAPGNSPGRLSTGNLALGVGANFSVEIGGTVAGTGYDQVDVTGTVDVTGATLTASLDGGFNPQAAPGGTFTIIRNDGADAVIGTFAGLAEGAQLTIGGSVFSISYRGGDGNDVTLTELSPPTLVSSVPTDNATDVAIGANIVLTFNEAVKAGTGNIILRPATGADVTIAVGSSQVTFNGNQVTINPTADLRPGVAYDVIIGSGVITDAAGNPFAGIAQDALDFVTSFTIPAGTFTAPFTISDPGTFTLLPGTTRTQTAGVGVTANVSGGAVAIDLEGTLNDTASGQRALNATLSAGGQITVGLNGTVQSLDADTIRVLAPNAKVDLTNLGHVVSKTSITAVSLGGTNPGTGFALNYNAVLGAAGAGAADYTSGGVITNGALDDTTALIESDSGDAIRMGSHMTLINYGTIKAAGPVDDSSSNNSFNGTSTAQTYDVSRGVRFNQSGGTAGKIENYGTIEGAQHGVDVGQTNITNLVINNHAGGTIIGHNGSGVGADTTGAAANTVTVENSGTIRGEYAPTFDRAGLATLDGDADGVDVDGAATIINHQGATIAGSGANGVLNGQGAGGWDSNGRANNSEGLSIGGGSVTNDGLISGANFGITVNNDSNPDNSRSGVLATTITNGATGTIIGQAGFAIRLENKTGNAAIDNDTIVNFGAIIGNGGIPNPNGTVLRENGLADPGVAGTLDGVTYTSAANAGNARFISGDGSAIQMGEGDDTLTNHGTITGNTGRAINMEGGNDTLNLYTEGSISGRIDGGAGSDTINLLGSGSATLSNVINVETLSVQGGTWTVADTQAYANGASIQSGTLLVDGSLGSSAIAVTNGATLGGHGTVGAVTLASGATLSPGASPGVLSTGSLTLAAGATFKVEIAGAGAGQFDQVSVTGTVNLAGATLAASLLGGFNPDTSSMTGYTIIANDGADAVTGTFAGLAEGALVMVGTSQFEISYHGGDGNDVVLTAVNDAPVNSVPGTLTVPENSSAPVAGLSIADVDAGAGVMTTKLNVAHGALTVASAGGASVTGSGTADVTLTGTLAQINATLAAANNLVYAPTHDFFGNDALTITTSDNGHEGFGGPLTDTDVVKIIVAQPTQAPQLGTAGDDVFTAPIGSSRFDGLGGIDTINFGFKLVDATISFSGNQVIVDGPNGQSHTVLTGFEIFKFTDGTVNDNDGDPLVDDLFYYSQYHDVWTAGLSADAHYHTVGWREARDPDAFFSTSTYLSKNPDVKAAGVDPLAQFDQFGWKEGRDASISFDPQKYLAANPDVRAAGIDPLAQFLASGAGEGRQPVAASVLLGPNGFDYVYYLQHNPDVAAAHVDPFQHYETVGWKEGRNPNAFFDTAGYLAHYADVAAAGINPLDHYNTIGWKEGRDPSVNFDTTDYLSHNPDVAAAHINPLTHFLQNGQFEGRSSFADGVWG